jgi:hypothetical protein
MEERRNISGAANDSAAPTKPNDDELRHDH